MSLPFCFVMNVQVLVLKVIGVQNSNQVMFLGSSLLRFFCGAL
ncbi:hypothetical protein C2W59_03349 [Bacillus pumilus]|uniref:Uncharacterized protein n=1 Tax=Bacillus pumilus TaxID=1408 RepID=A0AB34QT65_BACPU|nr:hypothetical protein B4127_2819 [Bacillus pumilus]RAP04275.1 hypothetical protein C2W58_02205 [Bacillus pumilus]RAP22767.1 hypothetical protein C2W59_03349 [Bacillus pumilus]